MSPPYLVSAVKDCYLMKNGYSGLLCSVLDTRGAGVKLEEIPIIRKFVDVFLEGLSSVII